MSATLLIDNHDSFTYNLAALIEETSGAAPLIVRNDAMDWASLSHLQFDRIVISPGPGRPQRRADLGLSADAITHARVPILGVCLGHQAIAHLHGSEVGPAPAPIHGRLSMVRHDGTGLFRDLPSPFTAVRYHSLAVLRLSDELEALAWAEDGTLMALRHRTRPLWGVQFHPESICAEHGSLLLRRFLEMSPARGSNIARPPERTSAVIPRSPPQWRIYARRLADDLQPQQVFAALFADSEHAFWLDSSSAPQPNAAVSYMGDASGPHCEVVSYRVRGNALSVTRRGLETQLQEDVLTYLQRRLLELQAQDSDSGCDFTAGYVGYFGYELKNLWFEGGHEAATPDAWWLFADRVVAFDHVKQQAWALCFDARDGLSAENLAWLDSLPQRLAAGALLEAPVRTVGTLGTVRWRHGESAYRKLIERSLQAIREGETYEVCLTNEVSVSCEVSPWLAYLALRAANPAPYGALLRCGRVSVLCSSPELFLQVSAAGSVRSKPIKGTAARAAEAGRDALIAAELASSVKSRSENLMIVDLLRNDLNRVCEVGSVRVPELFAVETYAFVHQLVSTITGTLRPGATAVDVVRAAFPGGSMTGAPKRRTLELLEQLESGPRGIYSGSLGYFSVSGAALLNIVIRSIVLDGTQLSLGTGGAIVALSDPDAEIAETLLKLTAVARGLANAGIPLADSLEPTLRAVSEERGQNADPA